jgi:hypothetical protein
MFSTEFNIPDLIFTILTDNILESDSSLAEGYIFIQKLLENPLYREVFPKICALYYRDFPI